MIEFESKNAAVSARISARRPTEYFTKFQISVMHVLGDSAANGNWPDRESTDASRFMGETETINRYYE